MPPAPILLGDDVPPRRWSGRGAHRGGPRAFPPSSGQTEGSPRHLAPQIVQTFIPLRPSPTSAKSSRSWNVRRLARVRLCCTPRIGAVLAPNRVVERTSNDVPWYRWPMVQDASPLGRLDPRAGAETPYAPVRLHDARELARAFVEASFVIRSRPDVLLMAMALGKPKKAFVYACRSARRGPSRC